MESSCALIRRPSPSNEADAGASSVSELETGGEKIENIIAEEFPVH
jgi:hypothetical protein